MPICVDTCSHYDGREESRTWRENSSSCAQMKPCLVMMMPRDRDDQYRRPHCSRCSNEMMHDGGLKLDRKKRWGAATTTTNPSKMCVESVF